MGCSCSHSLIHPLSSLTPSLKEYDFKSVLGQGGFALVKEMTQISNGKVVAVKEVDVKKMIRNGKSIEILFTELNSLRAVRSLSFVIQTTRAFYDIEREKCFFIMEPLYGGDLRFYLKNCEEFTEQQIVYFIACIGTALCHIHERNIIHRDVKPENISLDRHGRPYLTDFGISYQEKQSHLLVSTSTSGTLPYLSPETLTASHRHSYHADYWSLGVTAYELLYRYRPYKNHCPREFISFVDHHYSLVWKSLSTMPLVNYELIQFYCRPLVLPTTPMNSPYYGSSCDETESGKELPSSLSCLAPVSTPAPSDTHGVLILPLPPDSMKSSQLPSPFALSFPLLSNGQEISSECEDFLSCLLDPRIHLRYGAGFSSRLFLQHDVFQKHALTSPEILLRHKPLYLPNIKRITHHLNLKFEKINQQIKQDLQGIKSSHSSHPHSPHPPPPQSPHLPAISPLSEGVIRAFSFPQNSPSHHSHLGSENSFHVSYRGNGHLNSQPNNHLSPSHSHCLSQCSSEEKNLTKEILERLKMFYYNSDDDERALSHTLSPSHSLAAIKVTDHSQNKDIQSIEGAEKRKKNENMTSKSDSLSTSHHYRPPLSGSGSISSSCYKPVHSVNSTIVLPFESKSISVCVNSSGITEEQLPPVNPTGPSSDPNPHPPSMSLVVTEL